MPLGLVTSGLAAVNSRFSAELGLEQPLGVLLELEVDRQLDVLAVDRRLVAELADDAVVGVDLVDDLAPLAVEGVLHRQLDAGSPNLLAVDGRVVTEVLVVLLVVGGDRPHVPDHVAGQRSVRVVPPPALDDRDARKVLAALLDRHRHVGRHALLQRQRLVAAVALGVVAGLHVCHRHVEPPGEAGEQLGPVGVATDHVPVDGNGQYPLVVGEDPALGVEDAPPLRYQLHGFGLAGVDGLLQRVGLDGLQEPQPRPHRPEEQRGDDGEDAEAGGALVSRHRRPPGGPSTQAP